MERPGSITIAGGVATLLVAIFGWAANTSNRVASLEANQTAHEQRLVRAEKDADQYRQDTTEIRDRISRIEGYLKRLTQ